MFLLLQMFFIQNIISNRMLSNTLDSVNERLYGISVYSLLEFISRPDRHFEKKEMDPEIFKELFQENDWNGFDKEQVVIRGDTVYICVF